MGKRSPCLARSVGCLHDQTEQLDSPEKRQAISIRLGKNILLGETNLSFCLKIAYKFEHLLVIAATSTTRIATLSTSISGKEKREIYSGKHTTKLSQFPHDKKVGIKNSKVNFSTYTTYERSRETETLLQNFPPLITAPTIQVKPHNH